jgi:small GTP-binding protein
MIVGTAGHIDHGKTTLVKALTGVDADRLPEEKARGITLDLGYAYTPLADGSVLGFIDVPGHEKLIHNMLAGATGIDYVLLVIAADDGPMPQTREHLELLGLLGLDRGAVALTKCDAVDAARIAAARGEIAALLAACPLAACPVFELAAAPAPACRPCAPISKRRRRASRRAARMAASASPSTAASRSGRHRHRGHRHGILGKSRRWRHGDHHAPGGSSRPGCAACTCRTAPRNRARPANAAPWR